MGLIKKIVSGGSNKNDVKIAKLELEKVKIEKEAKKEKSLEERKQEQISVVNSYLEYSKNNFDKIENVILKLKSDIETTMAKIQSTADSKLSIKEKMQLKKEKESCQGQLKYLYLCKDYLIYLSKFASGIELSEEQSSLIVKFALYFDGTQVIEVEEYGDEDSDESIAGIFKEMGSIFYKSSDNKAFKFNFSIYLDKYHDEKVYRLEMPEVISAIETFKKMITITNEKNKLNNEKISSSQKSIVCTNCDSKVPDNVKFCPECGNKIEIIKPLFCGECGSSLIAGTKFCHNCGNKV